MKPPAWFIALWLLSVALVAGFWGTVGYVVLHFLFKVW